MDDKPSGSGANDGEHGHPADTNKSEASVVQTLDALLNEYRSTKEEGGEYERKTLFWHRATFWAVIGYSFLTMIIAAAGVAAAIYAGLGVREARRAADAATAQAATAGETLKATMDNFKQDQRPYVWLTNDLAHPLFVLKPENLSGIGQVVWDLHYTNYGKTPALGMRLAIYMKVGDRNFALSFGSDSNGNLEPLPPTKSDFTTVISVPYINPDEWKTLAKTDKAITIAGAINYSDGLVGDYESDFCLTQLASGAVMYCQDMKGNQMR
jgi:hypothetical protein